MCFYYNLDRVHLVTGTIQKNEKSKCCQQHKVTAQQDCDRDRSRLWCRSTEELCLPSPSQLCPGSQGHCSDFSSLQKNAAKTSLSQHLAPENTTLDFPKGFFSVQDSRAHCHINADTWSLHALLLWNKFAYFIFCHIKEKIRSSTQNLH